MVIGLLKTGHLTRATRAQVVEFFTSPVEAAQKQLDNKARGILEAAGVKSASEGDDKAL